MLKAVKDFGSITGPKRVCKTQSILVSSVVQVNRSVVFPPLAKCGSECVAVATVSLGGRKVMISH
jgi:hypothetical protein